MVLWENVLRVTADHSDYNQPVVQFMFTWVSCSLPLCNQLKYLTPLHWVKVVAGKEYRWRLTLTFFKSYILHACCDILTPSWILETCMCVLSHFSFVWLFVTSRSSCEPPPISGLYPPFSALGCGQFTALSGGCQAKASASVPLAASFRVNPFLCLRTEQLSLVYWGQVWSPLYQAPACDLGRSFLTSFSPVSSSDERDWMRLFQRPIRQPHSENPCLDLSTSLQF